MQTEKLTITDDTLYVAITLSKISRAILGRCLTLCNVGLKNTSLAFTLAANTTTHLLNRMRY